MLGSMALKLRKWIWASIPSLALILSSCSALVASVELKSLSELQNLADRNTELTKNKRTLITTLRESYGLNPKGTLNLLFEGWRYTLLSQRILERWQTEVGRFAKSFGNGSNQNSVQPNATLKGLKLSERSTTEIQLLAEQAITVSKQEVKEFTYKVESNKQFEATVKIKADLKINPTKAMSHIENIFKDDETKKKDAQNSLTMSMGQNEALEATFTYSPATQGIFGRASFDRFTSNIKLNTKLRIQVSSTSDLMKKLLENSLTSSLKDQSFDNEGVNLFPYTLFALL